LDGTVPAPNGFPDTLYYEADGLAGMTADLRAAFAASGAGQPGLRRRDPGRRRVPASRRPRRRQGRRLLRSRRGTYAAAVPQDKIKLCWDDYLHASKYGSYLSALVLFGQLTGIDPWSLGASERAADLGISPGDAVKLQHIASEQCPRPARR
jgi:hypothetical protein